MVNYTIKHCQVWSWITYTGTNILTITSDTMSNRLKVLNLYAGIGGNRKLWEDVEVTAVELDPQIAEIYTSYFPDDKMIVGDAHQLLLDRYKEFDFIWSSPPCQTNSRVREAGIKADVYKKKPKMLYHDLSLYQEVLLLQRYFNGSFVVENVEPFYTPLIPAIKLDRHLYWSNFRIGNYDIKNKKLPHEKADLSYLARYYGFKLAELPGDNLKKRQVLRNCVNPELGNYILNCARNIITKSNVNQLDFFV